jgi:hypothetical protein
MLNKPVYTKMWNRDLVVKHLQESNYSRVIDIGASHSQDNWAFPFTTHYIDLVQPTEQNKLLHNKIGFFGNISHPSVWQRIKDDVVINGPFDFAICSHVLEDIASPEFACMAMSQLCKAGFIAMPSKYAELKRREGPWRGYSHHRWIYNIHGDDILGYPKINALDYFCEFDEIGSKCNRETNEEIQLLWEGSIKLQIMNNDFIDLQMYQGLFHDA